jgi:hypothetical protein
MREEIDVGLENFHPTSFSDPTMRLLNYEGRLLRGVGPAHEQQIRRLFGEGVVGELMGRRQLVESKITTMASRDYPLIVEHKRLRRVTYPTEWCSEALRDAALCVLDMQIYLIGVGYTLVDAYPWNVLFERGKP